MIVPGRACRAGAARDASGSRTRTRRAASAAVLLALAAAACGKEGPPLPPLRPEPGHIREVSAVRAGDRVEILMQIPPANFDGTTPPVMDRVEVYMMTAAAGAPAPGLSELIREEHLRTVIPVRSPEAGAPAAPPKTLVARAGAATTFVDAVDRTAAEAAGAIRYYAVLGATGRSRRGRPSPVLPIPLEGAPPPPGALSATYEQETLTLTWPAAAGQTYRVYEAEGPGAGATATELTGQPLDTATFTLPVWFGSTRCFAVRAIETTERVSVVGPIGPGVCETPVDTFAPPAPGGLFAAQEGTGVVLRWTASEAPDLAGYLVLRGDGTGETLSQLFKTPIDGTRYVDTAIVPGATYVYAVVAVDRAANRSGESGRQQVTVRAPSE